MTGRPEKHSLTLNGHRTSVSLEPQFWETLKEIAAHDGVSVASLVGQIDLGREAGGGSLSGAIRVFILNRLRSRLAQRP